MQNFRNYYAILNLDPDVTLNEIKSAYRKLARQYHPDMNPGDKSAEERFKDVVEAYDVLGDPEKREKYDELRQWQRKQRNRNGGRNGKNNGKRSEFSQYGGDFDRFAEQVLGQQGAPRRRRARTEDIDPYRPGTRKKAYTVAADEPRSRDVEARLTIPLEKAYRGGRERIRLEDGRSLEIDMPPGMADGQQMRLRGQGIAGGDLYLNIAIPPHDYFELDGNDVFCTVPITPSEAVLGGAIEVPTLDGLVKVAVPAGVTSGKRLKLAAKGYPSEEGDRGDQLVELQIVAPKDLTPEEVELYEKLRELETFNPRRDAFKLGGATS